MRRQRTSSGILPKVTVDLLSSSSSSSSSEDDDDPDCEIITAPTTNSHRHRNSLQTSSSSSSSKARRQQQKQSVVNQTKIQQHQPQTEKIESSLSKKIYLDPKQPHKGWYIHSTLPRHLQIADRKKGFLHLLNNCRPKTKGQVQMYGKMVDIPRLQQAYLADYVFTGSCAYAEEKMDPVCEELLDWCNEKIHLWYPTAVDFGGGEEHKEIDDDDAQKTKVTTSESYKFNSSLVNWYLDGNQYMGPHSDDESSLFPNSPIFSLSLGETRKFRIRDRQHSESTTGTTIVKDIELKSNDFVVMGGRMQKNYLHEVVKVNGNKGKMMVGPRVNVTFRCFKNPTMTKRGKQEAEAEDDS